MLKDAGIYRLSHEDIRIAISSDITTIFFFFFYKTHRAKDYKYLVIFQYDWYISVKHFKKITFYVIDGEKCEFYVEFYFSENVDVSTYYYY